VKKFTQNVMENELDFTVGLLKQGHLEEN